MRILCVFLLASLGAAGQAQEFHPRDFGAKADGKANDRAAIQAALDACRNNGGGSVVLDPGVYLSGALVLSSNTTLRLEAGAVLQSIEEDRELPVRGPLARRHLIVAEHASNVSITGQGVIRGTGEDDYGWRWGIPMHRKFRSGLIMLVDCNRVRVEGVTLRFSESFTLVLDRCRNVVIHGIEIDNNLHHENTDGIDIFSSQDVIISDCHISAGDDAIVLKTAVDAPTERVLVSNCILNTTCSGLKFGTGTRGKFRDIHFSNVSIGYGEQGIAIFMKDGGVIDGVTFSQISMESRHAPTKYPKLADARRDPAVAPILAGPKATFADYNIWLNIEQYPILIDLNKRNSDTPYGFIRDVSFSGIHIRARSGLLVQGRPQRRIENLRMTNITIDVENPLDYEGRHLSVGGTQNHHDEFDTVYARRPSYATFAWIDGLELESFRVRLAPAAAAMQERTAVDVDHVDGLAMRRVNLLVATSGVGVKVSNSRNAAGK